MAGSGVWQDCQSLPTRTLHQRVDPHVGKENHHHHHSRRTPHSLHNDAGNTPALPTFHSGLLLILMQVKMPCVSCRGFFSSPFGLKQPGEGVVSTVIHIFYREEFGVFSIHIWDLV